MEFLTDRIEEKGKILFNVKRVGKGKHDNIVLYCAPPEEGGRQPGVKWLGWPSKMSCWREPFNTIVLSLYTTEEKRNNKNYYTK